MQRPQLTPFEGLRLAEENTTSLQISQLGPNRFTLEQYVFTGDVVGPSMGCHFEPSDYSLDNETFRTLFANTLTLVDKTECWHETEGHGFLCHYTGVFDGFTDHLKNYSEDFDGDGGSDDEKYGTYTKITIYTNETAQTRDETKELTSVFARARELLEVSKTRYSSNARKTLDHARVKKAIYYLPVTLPVDVKGYFPTIQCNAYTKYIFTVSNPTTD